LLKVEHDKIMQDLTSDPSVNSALLLRLEGNRAKQMDVLRKRLDSVTDVLGSMGREREEMRRHIDELKKGPEA